MVSDTWYARNKERHKANARRWARANPGRARELTRRSRAANWPVYALKRARGNAKRNGYVCTILPGEIQQPITCPVLGIPLYYGCDRRAHPNNATLDRIDNARGYVTGNVVTVSWRANRLKLNATAEELVLLARFYGECQCSQKH